MSDVIGPPPWRAKGRLPVVGMVGGGDLAMMTAQAAMGLGIEFRVLAADESRAAFAASCDVVTFEHDQVPPEHAAELERLIRAERETGGAGETGRAGWTGGRLVVLVARSPKGQGASYPVAAMTAGEGGVTEVITPAPGLGTGLAISAQRLALAAAAELGVTGLLAVELVPHAESGALVISDLAMGPHDAGLWTIDAARTSQFEQLLRAVVDLPLGATALTGGGSAATVTIVGGNDEDLYGRLVHVLAADPGVKVHLYATPGRAWAADRACDGR